MFLAKPLSVSLSPSRSLALWAIGGEIMTQFIKRFFYLKKVYAAENDDLLFYGEFRPTKNEVRSVYRRGRIKLAESVA
jgi:hypothetical protein